MRPHFLVMVVNWSSSYSDILTPTTYYTSAAPLETLILYNPTRLAQTYGITAVNKLTLSLRSLADDQTVKGFLAPVETVTEVQEAYAAWDDNYCSPQLANNVAESIRTHVISPNLEDTMLSEVKYLVIIGDDSQLPLYRQSDLTTIANEREFTPHSKTLLVPCVRRRQVVTISPTMLMVPPLVRN